MSGRKTIVIMAKAPIPGEAKTRLAVHVGNEAAAAIHHAFLQQTFDNALLAAEELGQADVAVMSPDHRHQAELRKLAPPAVRVWAQRRSGLMAGISEAFAQAFAEGADSVVVGESDSPNLPLRHMHESFRLLAQLAGDRPGIILGPCHDGGYYLVGGRGLAEEAARDLFEGQDYDGRTICLETAARATRMGLRVGHGPAWYDVDTIDELRQLRSELSTAAEPRFAKLLSALNGCLDGSNEASAQARPRMLG